MVIGFTLLHNRWLHGLVSDQGMTNFADGYQKQNEMLSSEGQASSFGQKGEVATKVWSCTEHEHASRPGNTSWAPPQEPVPPGYTADPCCS